MGDFDDIKSRVITPEYVEGHERTFGAQADEPRKAKRTTYVYRQGKMVELGGPEDTGPEVVEEDRASFHIVSDLYMAGTRADDGTDIGSRSKRRRYMAENGLSDVGDWKGYWAKKEKEREAIRSGEADKRERREAIGRAVYEASKRR